MCLLRVFSGLYLIGHLAKANKWVNVSARWLSCQVFRVCVMASSTHKGAAALAKKWLKLAITFKLDSSGLDTDEMGEEVGDSYWSKVKMTVRDTDTLYIKKQKACVFMCFKGLTHWMTHASGPLQIPRDPQSIAAPIGVLLKTFLSLGNV